MALTQHWKLDDNAASTTAIATVGTNGAYARNSSNTYTADGPGGSITASQSFVSGSSDFVSISGSSISFGSGTAWSASGWAKWGTFSSNNYLWGSSNSAVRFFSTTSIRVNLSGTTTDFTVATMGTGWHHVLVTRTTGNAMRVFVDGVESSSGSQTNTGSCNFSYISRSASIYSTLQIAWCKFFDSDESANVATLYAEGTGGGYINHTQTILHHMWGAAV